MVEARAPNNGWGDAEQGHILATKCTIPRSRSQRLSRTRLAATLDDGIETCRLVLVSTPAGFGKTTLLAPEAGKPAHLDPVGRWPLGSCAMTSTKIVFVSVGRCCST
jgi:hypothetical protein